MNKPVEFTETASFWLLNKDFVTEMVIINVVQDFPKNKREYVEPDCFTVSFRRRKKWIIIWVHEFPEQFLVYNLHSSNYPSVRK